MSAAAVARARERGFDVASTSALPGLRSSVTKLVPPAGMTESEANALLSADLPGMQFAPNHVYRFITYKAAEQGAGRGAVRTAAARFGSKVECDADRCHGRQAIQWKEHLHECSAGLKVGVIDTDIDHKHPTFTAGRIRFGSFVPEGRTAAPSWHGTGVAAVLAGSLQSGTPGLIPHAEFYVANVFFMDASGGFVTDTASLLKALDWMRVLNVELVNMSFNGPKDDLMQNAIAQLSAKGVILVAAVGNEGPNAPPGYPAAYAPVLAVTAVNRDMRNFPLANRGNHVDLAAPGVDIWTAVPGSREGFLSGTSFAAPYATAIVATVLGTVERRQKGEILKRLTTIDLGPPGRDPIYGQGLVTAPEACRPQTVVAAGSDRSGAAAQRASWSPVVTTGPAAQGTAAQGTVLGFK